jgi:superfamily II DNA helicase RecQ
MTRALGDDCVSVHGSMSPEEKVALADVWLRGEVRVIVSKPSILGWGVNFQQCSQMVFVGLSDSWESYYQCIRRCYRYGQTRRVQAHIVLSELESKIAGNVARKERQAVQMTQELVRAMRAAGELRTA